MELRETRLENKRVRDKKENKGVAEYFGANLAHMLNLVQVTESKDLPPSLGDPRKGLEAPATLGSAEGIRHGRRRHGDVHTNHCDTLLAEAGACS